VAAFGESAKDVPFQVARHRLMSANLAASLVRVAKNRLARTPPTSRLRGSRVPDGRHGPHPLHGFLFLHRRLKPELSGGWGWNNTSRGEIALQLLLNNPFSGWLSPAWMCACRWFAV
jgi:hypothetical protein